MANSQGIDLSKEWEQMIKKKLYGRDNNRYKKNNKYFLVLFIIFRRVTFLLYCLTYTAKTKKINVALYYIILIYFI